MENLFKCVDVVPRRMLTVPFIWQYGCKLVSVMSTSSEEATPTAKLSAHDNAEYSSFSNGGHFIETKQLKDIISICILLSCLLL